MLNNSNGNVVLNFVSADCMAVWCLVSTRSLLSRLFVFVCSFVRVRKPITIPHHQHTPTIATTIVTTATTQPHYIHTRHGFRRASLPSWMIQGNFAANYLHLFPLSTPLRRCPASCACVRGARPRSLAIFCEFLRPISSCLGASTHDGSQQHELRASQAIQPAVQRVCDGFGAESCRHGRTRTTRPTRRKTARRNHSATWGHTAARG